MSVEIHEWALGLKWRKILFKSFCISGHALQVPILSRLRFPQQGPLDPTCGPTSPWGGRGFSSSLLRLRKNLQKQTSVSPTQKETPCQKWLCLAMQGLLPGVFRHKGHQQTRRSPFRNWILSGTQLCSSLFAMYLLTNDHHTWAEGWVPANSLFSRIFLLNSRV